MKINKYWYFDVAEGYMHQTKYLSVKDFNPDEATIVTYGRDFPPIIFYRGMVYSKDQWKFKDFLRELNNVLSKEVRLGDRYRFLWLDRNTVKWGCREFKRHQLITIRDALIWHMEN